MKERTLQGVHKGQPMLLGYLNGQRVMVTVWDDILLLKRNLAPDYPLVRQWRGRLIAGGRFWREIPHAMQKNPLSMAYYPDTLMDWLTEPVRLALIPGLRLGFLERAIRALIESRWGNGT